MVAVYDPPFRVMRVNKLETSFKQIADKKTPRTPLLPFTGKGVLSWLFSDVTALYKRKKCFQAYFSFLGCITTWRHKIALGRETITINSLF